MYGKDKPLNSNSSINNVMKNISPNNINYSSNASNSSNSYSYENKNKNENISQISSSNTIGNIIFIIVIFFLFVIVYFFRDNIYKNIKELWNKFNSNSNIDKDIQKLNEENEKKKQEELKKKKEEEEGKKEKSPIEQEKEKEKQKELEKNGGLNQLNQKVNNLCKYRKDQIATSNGFCYLGYDLGKRECADIYAGEVCMSGKIFPSMELCLRPNSFRN